MDSKDNVLDYMDWRGDLSFSCAGINEVDSLIFSIFAYLDYPFVNSSPMTIAAAADRIFSSPDKNRYCSISFIAKNAFALLDKAHSSTRYKDVVITSSRDISDESRQMQFSAVTFLINDEEAFIAFRGTDESIIGWKEDLNMSFSEAVPSQLEATRYTETIIKTYPDKKFYLGGHSKGGNLAVWALCNLNAELQAHVIKAYSNDGPGFRETFWQDEGHGKIREKIKTFIPQSSIVGVLMEQEDYITIKASTPSLFQHDPFSWLLRGVKFIYCEERSLDGRQLERVINSWINSMSISERETLVDSLYEIVKSTNAKTLGDLLRSANIRSLLQMSKTFRAMGLKKQTQLVSSMMKLAFNDDTLTNYNPLTLFSDDVKN